MQGALSLWDIFTEEQKILKLANVVSRLRRRGILDLLHMRFTKGSIERLPIPRHRLLQAAEQLHHPNALLTVCARARDKHIVRDSTGRWGEPGGCKCS
ncbi:unnamed protein product [Echinostoma caproni]|uniref:SAM domain-containing protein n=1 Tax=Echinostoma caproni TaxID=27848 RepID=A0A183B641_9TREM|nr:unnamed protein product [Echinostoma caproni]